MAGRSFYASEISYLSTGPNQVGIWHQKYGGSLFALAITNALISRNAPLTTSSLGVYAKDQINDFLEALKNAKARPSDARQDLQYILGRDAKDFVLAAKD